MTKKLQARRPHTQLNHFRHFSSKSSYPSAQEGKGYNLNIDVYHPKGQLHQLSTWIMREMSLQGHNGSSYTICPMGLTITVGQYSKALHLGAKTQTFHK